MPMTSPTTSGPLASSTDLSGQTIAGGRYHVDRKLGTGSMGHVFLAHDVNLETEVVVKVPTLARLENEEFRTRFLQESRVLVKLGHPHIVRILDVGEFKAVPYFVMQYIGGGSLDDRIYDSANEGPGQSPDEVADWLPRVAGALDFVHMRGFIHRDVKPANILFDEFGHAYLSDFGLSRFTSPDEQNSRMTAAGAVVGTPNYVAPEVVLGQKYAGHADQYSLAMMVYEALTGVVPLEGPSPSATMVNQTSKMPPAPSTHNAALSPEVDAVLLRALSKGPLKRYPNCLEFSNAFLEAAGLTSAGSGAQKRSGERATAGTTPAPPSKIPARPASTRSTVTSAGDTQISVPVQRYSVKKTTKIKRDGTGSCPKCSHELKLRHKHAGQKGQCVKCRGLLVITRDLKEVKHVVINRRAGQSNLSESDFALRLGTELFGWKLPLIAALVIAVMMTGIILSSVSFVSVQANRDLDKEKADKMGTQKVGTEGR